jgi:hypothetical protein
LDLLFFLVPRQVAAQIASLILATSGGSEPTGSIA